MVFPHGWLHPPGNRPFGQVGQGFQETQQQRQRQVTELPGAIGDIYIYIFVYIKMHGYIYIYMYI